MKFSKKLILAFLASILCSYTGAFATGVDYFKVELTPNKAKVNEALDLKITALDSNDAIVTNYEGTVLIYSDTDVNAKLPSSLDEQTFTFTASDGGVFTFENGVTFTKAGIQELGIYSLATDEEDVLGIGQAEISEEVVVTDIDISIISPEQGLTIGENSIIISGKTQKNHQIKIIVNGDKNLPAISNDDGIFEKKVEGLENGTSTFKAQVLDAELNVVGESDEVSIKVELNDLSIKNVKLTPSILDSEDSFEIEVISKAGLSKVTAVIDDVLIELKETEDGIYVARAVAPKVTGTYIVDINIQDELGHKKTELGAATLKVNAVILSAGGGDDPKKPIIITIGDPIGGGTGEQTNRELKITGLKLVELKTKSILTWDELENIESYNIYKKINEGELELIDNVKIARYEVDIVGDEDKYDYFAVKAVAKNSKGEIFEGTLSDATKIKTGPEVLILLILSLLIGGFFFIKKQKNA